MTQIDSGNREDVVRVAGLAFTSRGIEFETHDPTALRTLSNGRSFLLVYETRESGAVLVVFTRPDRPPQHYKATQLPMVIDSDDLLWIVGTMVDGLVEDPPQMFEPPPILGEDTN